jgi:hypothetical protein
MLSSPLLKHKLCIFFLFLAFNLLLLFRAFRDDEASSNFEPFDESSFNNTHSNESSFNNTHSNEKKRDILIQTFSSSVFMQGGHISDCSIGCSLITEGGGLPFRNDYEKMADGIIYHDLFGTKLYSNLSKINLLYAAESFSLYPDEEVAFQQEMGKTFDISVNYHLSTDTIVQNVKQSGRKFSHFTATYAPVHLSELYKPPLPFEKKQNNSLAAIFVSNCHITNSHREEWINKLALTMGIDSFGGCYTNKQAESVGCGNLSRGETKQCVIRQYKFYLSFENSIDESYVTEKYWESLIAGTGNHKHIFCLYLCLITHQLLFICKFLLF